MKNRYEQIEKMAKIMCGCDCGPCGRDCRCASYKWAKKLYSAGYRKQSGSVREVAEKIAEKLRDKEFSVKIGKEWVAVVKSRDIDELVKEVCGE